MTDSDRTVVVAFGHDTTEIEVEVYNKELTQHERNTLADSHKGKVLFVDEDEESDPEWIEHGSFVPWSIDEDAAEASYNDDESLATFSVRPRSPTALLPDFGSLERDVWYDVTATFENGRLRTFELERADADRGGRA